MEAWGHQRDEAVLAEIDASGRKLAKLNLDWYLARPLLGGRILATTPVKGLEDMLADVRAQLWTKTSNGVEKRYWRFRLVRESAPSTPSPKGQWGVNVVAPSISR
jgi:hypothetical protein